MSRTEAEYIALSEAVKESIWIRKILLEIESRVVERPLFDAETYHEQEVRSQWKHVTVTARAIENSWTSNKPQLIHADYQGCIKLAGNP